MRKRTPFGRRFWRHVDARESLDECWEWTGARDGKGYGAIQRNGSVAAHRESYRMAYGPIPPGLGVLHRCDNPPCVNPTHLFLGTQADNSADMVAKGRTPPAKLTGDQVDAIRADSRTQRVIAAEYGVSQRLIWSIKNRRAWTHR